MRVIKRNGRKEAFDRKKIVKGLKKSGAKKHAEKIANIVERELAGLDEVTSVEIRERVLANLHSMDAKLVEEFINFRKAIRKLSSQEEYLENRVRDIVGSYGTVRGVYGGFCVTVKNEAKFDYCGVLKEFLNSKLNVQVELDGSCIVIMAR